jgi:hypothetical protein|tara:strand:+ start:2721 stop:2939 length:219 start_codon:yes stop_codon:yes gene_type:complete
VGKKLKLGDKVKCSFLGEKYTGKIVEIKSSKTYNIEILDKISLGTILPNVGWFEKPKKEKDTLPWYIHEKIK